jgi:hypothetical protein
MNNEQENEIRPELRKRPKLVWVISIWYILSLGWTALSLALIYGGVIQINEAQKTYFDSLNTLTRILTIFIYTLNVIGAILLFLLRRYAYYCFLTAFAIGIFSTIYQTIYNNWFSAINGLGLIGLVFSCLFNIAIIYYSWSLIKKNILK